MNPVKAGLLATPQAYRWSSANAHLKRRDDCLVRVEPLLSLVGPWRRFLSQSQEGETIERLQMHERTGRPLGNDSFLAKLERRLGRPLRPRKPGRKPKRLTDEAAKSVWCPPNFVQRLTDEAANGTATVQPRTMVEARLDDGQRLLALNELFVGVRTHQSARYSLRFGNQVEHQCSSGLIVATGTGSTGWARSILGERQSNLTMPKAGSDELAFLVREAFPSITSGTELTEGLIRDSEKLVVVSEVSANGVVFGDGIEDDNLPFDWGSVLTVRSAPRHRSILYLLVHAGAVSKNLLETGPLSQRSTLHVRQRQGSESTHQCRSDTLPTANPQLRKRGGHTVFC